MTEQHNPMAAKQLGINQGAALQAALKVVSAILENKLELLSSMLQLSCLQNAYS